MDFSDDEEELPQYVTNYHFIDERKEPISLCVLPMRLGDGASLDGTKKSIFLHGVTDGGLQTLGKEVVEWKLDLEDELPHISVFAKEGYWIKLQKPRKSFEDTIRTVLMTIFCVHYAKKNAQASDAAHWENLRTVFSSYEVRPSRNDLLCHLPLIRALAKTDEAVTKSKFIHEFLEDPKKRAFNEDVYTVQDVRKMKFIVDDDEDIDDGGDDDGESDLFDYVCAICDNGGEIICCEGKCMRSFHATKEAGVESNCKSLGMSMAEVQAVKNFYCPNCQYKQHQCFACGKLGSSDVSSGAEVFCCVSATCGHFYHPGCVAKLLHEDNEAEAEEHSKQIVSGESFTCPVHRCYRCKEAEKVDVHNLQFAICRRCPRAYHRKCLPSKIHSPDTTNGQRAWEGLMPNRILIYCLRHKISEDLKTPIRNHIKFPNVEKKNPCTSSLQSFKGKIIVKRKGAISQTATKTLNMVEKGSAAMNGSDSPNKGEKLFTGQGADTLRKSKTLDVCKKPLKDGIKPKLLKVERSSSTNEARVAVREMPTIMVQSKGMEPTMPKPKVTSFSKPEKIASPLKKKLSCLAPLVGVETEKKIHDLMEKISSEITLEDIMPKHGQPSTHACSFGYVDKTITEGKVEATVEAVRTALKKIEEGGSIEDAKVVCEPRILYQIIKWKKKLNVYLAPFIHGVRYTSFGRHFTKVDKLKEIVDMLHWYVKSDDMIVDFCCGSNDFSCLMRDKLKEAGKNCSFKNYDLIQAKDDFCFEKRDWMSVRREELPTGSRLIMGLNPPFGVKASLANNFINKALEFKPKLLILIVPEVTERLDRKKDPYDLIWKDGQLLSGKSFYFPGSVDADDKQVEDWNVKAPPLYLWSHPEWTMRHRAIAIEQGHISGEQTQQFVVANKQARIYEAQQVPSMEEDQLKRQSLGQMEDDDGSDMEISEFLNDSPKKNDQVESLEETEQVEELKEGCPKYEGQVEQCIWEDSGNRGAHTESHRHLRKNVDEEMGEMNGKRKFKQAMAEKSSATGTSFNRTDAMNMPGGLSTGGERRPRCPKPGISCSNSEHAVSGSRWASFQENASRDDLRAYTSNMERPFASRTHEHPSRSYSGLGHFHGIRGLEEHIPEYSRERNVDSFSRNADAERLVKTFRHSDLDTLREQIHMYGRQEGDDVSQASWRSMSQPSSEGNQAPLSWSTFGLSRPEVEMSRHSTSVSQRYAPRLEETNLLTSDRFMPEMPLRGGSNVYDPPTTRVGFQTEMRGFAPGPWRPFPAHQNSSGWLHD